MLTLRSWGGVVTRKIFPLSYPEKSRLFLKYLKEAFCKGLGSKNVVLDCLEATWKFRVAPKKCKNVKILPNNMTFHTDQDLKSKKFTKYHDFSWRTQINLLTSLSICSPRYILWGSWKGFAQCKLFIPSLSINPSAHNQHQSELFRKPSAWPWWLYT